MKRGLLGCLLLLAAAVAGAVPNIVIFRLNLGPNTVAGDIPIADVLANEIRAGARLNPIVWDITDPAFREAVEAGRVRGDIPMPTLDQARQASSALKADYLLAVDVRPADGSVMGAAYLYKGGRLVWKDPDADVGAMDRHYRDLVKKKKMTQEEYEDAILRATHRVSSLQVGAEFGMNATLKSLARTWVEQMNTGPFRGLEPVPVSKTPDPGAGQQPPVPHVDPVPQPPIVDTRWETDYAAATKANDFARGVTILRDAVDAEPFDVRRRTMLVKALMKSGRPAIGAREARNGAELMPDKVELRVLAARAWILAGNGEEAQLDLNEAVARAPESAETRMLLADVAIAKGDLTSAMEHLNKAIAVSSSGDAYFKRSLANALAGNEEASAADMKQAVAAGLSSDADETSSRFQLVVSLWDGGIASLGAQIKTLQQRALVGRSEAAVKAEADGLLKMAACRAKFIAAVQPPKVHESSHNRRVLAYKLLSQCLIDLESFIKTGNEDVLTDSRINLGEALKQTASAQQAFLDEKQGTKSDGKPG